MATARETESQKSSRVGKSGRAKSPARMAKRASGQSARRESLGSTRQVDRQGRTHSTFTGARVFDRTLQKTNTWLKEVMEIMDWQNRERALTALRASLHALRDILPLRENIHLGAQLPILMRGIYFENWHYHPEPLRIHTIGEFYELVREKLGQGGGRFGTDEIRRFTRACIFVLTKHVSAGEVYDIKGMLRRNLRDLISISFEELDELKRSEVRPREARSMSGRTRASSRSARKKLAHAKEMRQQRVEQTERRDLRELH